MRRRLGGGRSVVNIDEVCAEIDALNITYMCVYSSAVNTCCRVSPVLLSGPGPMYTRTLAPLLRTPFLVWPQAAWVS